MKRRLLIRTILFSSSVLLVTVTSCTSINNQSSSYQPPEIKIGVLFPLTGDAASYGEKGKKAIELAVEEINAKEVKKATAIFEDSRAEPKTGVTATQKLIDVDKVPVIVGDIVSAVTLAIAPIAEKNQVVVLAPTSSAPAITNAGEYIYRIWPSDLVEGTKIAERAAQKGFKNVAILHLNNDYGLAIANIFQKTFEQKGGKVVLKEGYLDKATDFRPVLSKIANLKPDVIYVAGYFADTARILKQSRELAIQSQFLGTTAIEDDEFIKLAGNAAEGMIYPLATGFDPTVIKNSKVDNFVNSFEKKYKYKPGWVEGHSYDAFMMAYQAANSSDAQVTGTSIKKYFDTMKSYEGVTGKIVFDKNGDVVKPVVFKTIQKSKFVAIGN
ncbi:ABC transporter substrate-binding protein [Scytonema sp. UIC 10036]|uniref:ABC transporter substrate-binding protein n=1 Tax=Scytonema sp. UIC 10036 TaxID=2304196 RepID=UPI0012DAAEA7|nr:penicillin-binding protein activator [Scytonema sp. UIC 10036]MUG99236.1 ABC transporter substrate-binding protein [Scytonema sp. UIC 10036]